jgi:hypothetical protein
MKKEFHPSVMEKKEGNAVFTSSPGKPATMQKIEWKYIKRDMRKYKPFIQDPNIQPLFVFLSPSLFLFLEWSCGEISENLCWER